MARSGIAVIVFVCVVLVVALVFMYHARGPQGTPGGPQGPAPTRVKPTDETEPATPSTVVADQPEPKDKPMERPTEPEIGPLGLVEEFSDDFSGDELDLGKWAVTREHDFAEFAVDLASREGAEGNSRLRLRCGTRGTDDKTVKALGVVSLAPLSLTGKKRLSYDFDWNKQANGCYLTGAIYLCPTLTKANPEDEPQWVRLEYVGVPPGKNARLAIWLKDRRTPKWIYNEGWPKEQRSGRPVAAPHLAIQFDDGRWSVSEDGRKLFESTDQWKLPFAKAHLYLQMTSHSNYPPREIFFDNVEVKRRSDGNQ